MATGSTSREAILAASRRVVLRGGPGRLTLSAVAAAAGVSRPTLYRWFPTKDDLLAAISTYEREQFDLGLRAVVRAQRGPGPRLDAALRYLVTYLDGVLDADPIGADPRFALQSLNEHLPEQTQSLNEHLPEQTQSLVRLLGNAVYQVPAVRRGELSSEQAAEMFVRVAYSHYLVPHPEPEVLLANLRAFAGLAAVTENRAIG
ncbi:TetR/AcrR family transcriptional regulator [Frankia sp. AgB1.9]|uniref:TetR/AcrR family transcriptional regulator n=1 Tax=unclassified Frankia TaxID=2632575 RepID=UPI0019344B9A|nr:MULTISPECIES: TetR/AcrR family transcriptional regulator [unclassified Frankia]MBL7548323.1 TetR/AcrR family transcriptional regulator [Frankia sp. AgB1.9]MBL7625237.1 TetR/AcrR family transcriptional regulator [Frankia sp. AgB1.8]